MVCGNLTLPNLSDLASEYEAPAKVRGDDVTVLELQGPGHFDMLAPGSQYGKRLIEAVFALLK
jgi:hypothetical protein